MKEKNISKRRKIAYGLLSAVLVLAVGALAVFFAIGPVSPDTEGKVPTESSKPDTSVDKPSDSVTPPGAEKPDDPSEDDPKEPVVEIITFLLPVSGGTAIKDYTDGTVVYSNTLGIYTGHLAMDFAGAEGADVIAAYGGTVESITTAYLKGTTVTIDHGKGLKTVYNSIEPIEGLASGQKVEKGQVIGKVSTNNKQEYKDGPHLHFEVWENGESISPLKYLTVEEK